MKTAALSNLFTGSEVGFDRRHDGWIQITEEKDKKRKEFAQQITFLKYPKWRKTQLRRLRRSVIEILYKTTKET